MTDFFGKTMELLQNAPVATESTSSSSLNEDIIKKEESDNNAVETEAVADTVENESDNADAETAEECENNAVETEKDTIAEESETAEEDGDEEEEPVVDTENDADGDSPDTVSRGGRKVNYTDSDIASFSDVFTFADCRMKGKATSNRYNLYVEDVKKIKYIMQLRDKNCAMHDVLHNILNLYFAEHKDEIKELIAKHSPLF